MILKGNTMIQKSEAKELEALIYGVLEKFFQDPASGAIYFEPPKYNTSTEIF